ncbi:MAG TPA: hypothetical protein VD971_11805 [Phycisphaerales bacterium]|nr:hypothetical protein [Phycisphaerales bacterium]
MHPYARNIVIALLTLAQVALGASGGRVACFGGHAEGAAASPCSHGDGHGGLHLPTPVEPEGHDEDCPCVDVPSPLSRVEDRRAGVDVMRDAAVLLLLPVPPILVAEPAAPAAVRVRLRPPDTPPGPRTARLNI